MSAVTFNAADALKVGDEMLCAILQAVDEAPEPRADAVEVAGWIVGPPRPAVTRWPDCGHHVDWRECAFEIEPFEWHDAIPRIEPTLCPRCLPERIHRGEVVVANANDIGELAVDFESGEWVREREHRRRHVRARSFGPSGVPRTQAGHVPLQDESPALPPGSASRLLPPRPERRRSPKRNARRPVARS
jgi:hypothetical protein